MALGQNTTGSRTRIREGRLQPNRKIDETIVSFDDVYSEDTNDLNVIQFIANPIFFYLSIPQFASS